MLELAVIADDLTGAADTGVQFRRNFNEVLMLNGQSLPNGVPTPRSQAVSVYTGSRGLAPEDAARAARRVAKVISNLNPKLVYKKIDSCLRGNLGPEIDAILEAMILPRAIVVPALPKQGRQTVGGVHYVHGIPVAESEVGQDPVSPVVESRIDRLLKSQSHTPTGCIGLEIIRRGIESLEGELNRQGKAGHRIIVCDSKNQEDLDIVARLVLGRYADSLFVGSAGLAESISRIIPNLSRDHEQDGYPDSMAGRMNTVLLVCGTAANATREQVEVLNQHRPIDAFSLSPPQLMAIASDDHVELPPGLPAAVNQKSGLVLKVDPKTGPTPAEESDGIVRGLARLAFELIVKFKPDALFLSGGDTASAVFDRLGSVSLRLYRELQPGLVLGRINQGVFAGLPVACKPGAFGREDYLVKLMNYWTTTR